MADDTRAIEEWKSKYFDQLERLETKEASWEQLESTLKRAVGRLSIAAEGQNEALDGCLGSLRRSIKSNVNHLQIELIIDDISVILAQLEEKSAAPDRLVTDALLQLIARLNFSDSQQKACKKIIKKLEKSDDSQRDNLLADTANFLNTTTITADTGGASSKSSFLSRVLSSAPAENEQGQSGGEQALGAVEPPDLSRLLLSLNDFFTGLPWAVTDKKALDSSLATMKAAKTVDQLQTAIHQLADTVSDCTSEKAGEEKGSRCAVYKDCLIDLIDALEEGPLRRDLESLKVSVQLADEDDALEELAEQLSSLLLKSGVGSGTAEAQSLSSGKPFVERSSEALHASLNDDDSLQPTIQELLIRLLEQLIVPNSLQAEADKVKQKLENMAAPGDWKQLLKDVANLINAIRLSMQAEKHEFESFLQQVTGRLKDMDLFLQSETIKLESAKSDGLKFDEDMQSNVKTIREDVNQATELPQLKVLVDKKLAVISEHINSYRMAEDKRAQQSKEDVESMHQRMQVLENEAESLKKVIVEKNQQAMFDTLTNVPNRLSYEQKMEDEFARWQRTDLPLVLAVWDIDFFKKINDNFGHKAGDKVLETIAQLLNKRIRKSDFFARYGGEEFVMLLPNTEGEEALKLANDLRENIQSCSFHYRGEDVRVTVSCGLSSFSRGDSADQVFERADKSLYEAKEAGRNRCVLAAD
ncbi:MAG: hypothetical protein COA75_02145 [Cellvibrionales bacterium]|nr:MAG: hypothetical protein COA75_02145 [Cellvibrionales bacterium]